MTGIKQPPKKEKPSYRLLTDEEFTYNLTVNKMLKDIKPEYFGKYIIIGEELK